jgi:hypothetical protein
MLRCVMELQFPKDSARFFSREGFIQSRWFMRRQAIQNDLNALGLWIKLIDPLSSSRCSRNTLPGFTDQTSSPIVIPNLWPQRVIRLLVQIQHIFHTNHILSAGFWNAPHLLLPRLQPGFVERLAHGFVRNRIHNLQLHQLSCLKPQGPALMPVRRFCTSRGYQCGFASPIQFTFLAWPRIFIQRALDPIRNKAFADPFNTWAANVQC